jgi:LysM repeat protein
LGTETIPLDGSDDRRVDGQGFKMPPQTPVTSVAAAQAAQGAGDNPEAAMGAGQYPRVGPNTTIAANSDAANAERDGAPVAPAKPNPYDMFKKADGSPAAPPGFKPPPPGVIWSEPDAGEQATKVARFKELIAKAKATDTPPAATKESIGYFLNKLRLIESRQLNETLTPEEQAEMDALSAELGQEGAEGDEELVAAINDYNSLPKSAPAPASAPAEKGEETFNKISGKWERSPASAAAAPASAAAAGSQANDAAMANANYSYVEKGSDQALAIDNGYGYNVAAWRAAGSPGKPRTQAQDDQNDLDTSSQPASANFEYPAEGPVNDSMTNTSNHQMAQNRNGIDPITGQNVSIQNPDGSTTNPESGKTTTAAKSTYKGSAGAQKIQSLNKDIIKDVNKIYPGTPLAMPDKSIYTVKPGDTLDKIAKDYKPAGDRIDVPKQNGNAPAPVAAPIKPAPVAAPVKPAPVTPVAAPVAAPAKPAPVAAPVATGSGGGRGPTAQEFTNDWNNKMKAAQKLGWPDSTKLPPADWAPMGKPVTGKNKMAPDLKEAVTYADDQTLARIISLSRR